MNLYREFLKLQNLNKIKYSSNITCFLSIITYGKLYDHVEQQYKKHFHHHNYLEDNRS